MVLEKYEIIEIVGEGSYGLVMKCRHRATGQIVAIKKFLESEEDMHVRKMAFREIRMLKRLQHENLVNMIEVFRRRKRFYIVFEYLDHTVLDELENAGVGLGVDLSKRYIFQVLRGLQFCHYHQVMHRDIKPENVLVSPHGVVKLCDFGFARYVTGVNESCTDYVATRWYRAPELLVGDTRYGRGVDVWAAGCLYAEMVTGDPLFPGDSDVDQLYRVTKVLGGLCAKHQLMMGKSTNNVMMRLGNVDQVPSGIIKKTSLQSRFPAWSSTAIDFLSQCLKMDPEARPKCTTLLKHPIFTQDGFTDKFMHELRRLLVKDSIANPLTTQKVAVQRIDLLPAEKKVSKLCLCRSERWHISLLKDSKDTARKGDTESTEKTESNSGGGSSALQVNPLQDACYTGPVSVATNSTQIRRLKKKGLLHSTHNDCFLPALTSRDYTQAKINSKRKRIDLPHVDR